MTIHIAKKNGVPKKGFINDVSRRVSPSPNSGSTINILLAFRFYIISHILLLEIRPEAFAILRKYDYTTA